MLREFYALLVRGPMFRVMVRDEILAIVGEYDDRAHAYVVEKLKRTDLTSRYRVILREVERRLRTQSRRRGVSSHFARTPSGFAGLLGDS